MKLSESKVIKTLNGLATLALIFYIIILVIKLFSSGVPNASKGIKWYDIYNVKIESVHKTSTTTNNGLGKWFNDRVFVSETKKAYISLRFKTYDELFSFQAITFQLSYFIYLFSIGYLILSVKRFFKSLTKNEIFTRKNSSIILLGGVILILLPILRWLSQELFINCINTLNINDSGLSFSNGEGIITSETIMGLIILAFGFAFKVGVGIKQENESFV